MELLTYYCLKELWSHKICILITPINSRQRTVNCNPPLCFQQQQQKKKGVETYCSNLGFQERLTEQNLRVWKQLVSIRVRGACVSSFLLKICFFTPKTVPSHSCWPQPCLVLLGIHSLESEMCLHLEHVTNYLLRLTLRDLAEAFTLLRCCLGQPFFRGWLCQFDCLYLTGFYKPDVNPGKR